MARRRGQKCELITINGTICETDLDYALIAHLQADDLVDRELTPQTRASIRIVLGALAAFSP